MLERRGNPRLKKNIPLEFFGCPVLMGGQPNFLKLQGVDMKSSTILVYLSTALLLAKSHAALALPCLETKLVEQPVGTICETSSGHLFQRVDIEGKLGVKDLAEEGTVILDDISPDTLTGEQGKAYCESKPGQRLIRLEEFVNLFEKAAFEALTVLEGEATERYFWYGYEDQTVSPGQLIYYKSWERDSYRHKFGYSPQNETGKAICVGLEYRDFRFETNPPLDQSSFYWRDTGITDVIHNGSDVVCGIKSGKLSCTNLRSDNITFPLGQEQNFLQLSEVRFSVWRDYQDYTEGFVALRSDGKPVLFTAEGPQDVPAEWEWPFDPNGKYLRIANNCALDSEYTLHCGFYTYNKSKSELTKFMKKEWKGVTDFNSTNSAICVETLNSKECFMLSNQTPQFEQVELPALSSIKQVFPDHEFEFLVLHYDGSVSCASNKAYDYPACRYEKHKFFGAMNGTVKFLFSSERDGETNFLLTKNAESYFFDTYYDGVQGYGIDVYPGDKGNEYDSVSFKLPNLPPVRSFDVVGNSACMVWESGEAACFKFASSEE